MTSLRSRRTYAVSGRASVFSGTSTMRPMNSGFSEFEDLTDALGDEQHTSFFQKGREFESRYDNHKYTAKERELLSAYDSFDYLPPHSSAFKVWLRKQPQRFEWDRWVMMGMIGFTTGFIGFLLHQLIDVISDKKWELVADKVKDNDLFGAWGMGLWYSLLFVVASTVLVVVFRPAAAGSGIPELIGFLNGTVIRAIFNVKTFIVKFFSCAFAVGSGLPVGPEGPMIHLGALIGAGLSQFRSKTLGFETRFFTRFRNSEDRRNFTSAGAGAGISSAFGSPVGGLLFAMEEVSSFWNMKLGWQTFFCTMTSAFTTDLFNSAFDKFKYVNTFGQFLTTKYILFDIHKGIAINLLLFIPAVIIGAIGGCLGAFFTFGNVKISRFRRKLQARIKSPIGKKLARMIEPVIIMVITVTVTVLLPNGFPCEHFRCGLPKGYSCNQGNCYPTNSSSNVSPRCLNSHPLSPSLEKSEGPAKLQNYTCPIGNVFNFYGPNGTKFVYTNATYSEVATLLFGTGEETVRHLFSRATHLEFGWKSLVTVLVLYFILACWAAGSAISSGLVVPMLLIGALYGRLIGYIMVRWFGIHDSGSYWAWIDPGAFALIGASSFFGGVSRLTMSLSVIMMEITNDVQFLLPIMVAIMVAKWTGDYLTHPLYHALLELKCIPFLDEEPVIVHGQKGKEKKSIENLELYQAQHAMSSPPVVIRVQEKVSELAKVVLFTQHGGFPVVIDISGKQVFCGHITRLALQVLLSQGETLFQRAENLVPHDMMHHFHHEPSRVDVAFENLAYVSFKAPPFDVDQLTAFSSDPKYDQLYFDLMPYINQSQPTVPETFSLHRTYIIFRTLGLRHLPVVDLQNRVVGIISRKDLMGFALEEKIAIQADDNVPLQSPTNSYSPSVDSHYHLMVNESRSNTGTPNMEMAPAHQAAWAIARRDITVNGLIDVGDFGDVFSATFKGSRVTVQSVRKEAALNSLLAQMPTLFSLKHPQLIQIIGLSNDGGESHPALLVIEFLANGSLSSYLLSHGPDRISAEVLIQFSRDVSLAMAFLESKKIVHGDLSARRVFVSSDLHAKVADLSMVQFDRDSCNRPVRWTAPETLRYGTFSTKSDVWSFGILLWEIYSFGQVPYYDVPLVEVLERVEQGLRPRMPDTCPSDACQVMELCLQLAVQSRPSFSDISTMLVRSGR